jgi:FkbM family methyltransferase
LVGPVGHVVAFEPDPDNFALLRRNVELNGYGNVELVNAAVSDRPGRCRLYRSGDNAGDHRLNAAPEDRPSVEVEVVTVDDVLRGAAENLCRRVSLGCGQWLQFGRGGEPRKTGSRPPSL